MDSNLKCSKDWYKWIIVAASFINQAGTIGFFMSLSVLYVSWLEEFQEIKSVTSWILSIGFLVLQGFSPVPAHLSELFGYRAVAFAGGLLTCAGLVASTFATSVVFLMVTIGFVTGVGTNFCYLPSVAIVAIYFEKRRSLAMGIAAAGAGVGAFVLGPLTNFLVAEYSWRGATLLLSGISLNMCVTGLLFTPVQNKTYTDFEDEYETTVCLGSEETEGEGTYEKEKEAEPLMAKSLQEVPSIKLELVEENETGAKCRGRTDESSQTLNLKGVLLRNFLAADDHIHVHTSLNELRPKKVAQNIHNSVPNLSPHENNMRKKKSSHESLIRSIQNVDVALLASVCGSRLLLNGDGDTTSQPPKLQGSENSSEVSDSGKNKSWFSRFLNYPAIKKNLDLLRDRTFFIFCISNFLTCLSFFTPVVYLVDRAVHLGIDKSVGAALVSASGCGNIVGRLFTGFVADWCSHNRMMMFSICLVIQGVGTMLSSLCGEIAVLHGIYATFFGFHMGIYATLLTVVTVDLQGASNVATAYGLVLTFLGLGSLLGAPIAGSLFDWSKSYVLPYVANGVFLVISGSMLIPTACRMRKEKYAC